MNADPASVSRSATQWLQKLAGEIGPRPAGSSAETRARNLLSDALSAIGYQVQHLPVQFAPRPRYFPYLLLPTLAFPISAWLLLRLPWLSLLLPLLVAALPELRFAAGALLPQTAASHNLLALPPGTALASTRLVLCAHLDTAPAIPPGPSFWQRLRDEIFPVMMRLAIIQAAAGLVVWLGLGLPAAVVLAVQTLAITLSTILLLQEGWEQAGSRGTFSAGANDNASGAAVLAALAEHLAANPSPAGISFLFTTAEETGLHGARQFAQWLRENQAKPRLICLDMVGAGAGLRIISRFGTFVPLKTDPALNALLNRADPLAETISLHRRGGDFIAFLQQGFTAAAIESDGTGRSWRAYHTIHDLPAIIDPSMMEHTCAALLQLVWLLEKESAAQQAHPQTI